MADEYSKSHFYAGNSFLFGVIAAVIFDFRGFTALCGVFMAVAIINLIFLGWEKWRAD